MAGPPLARLGPLTTGLALAATREFNLTFPVDRRTLGTWTSPSTRQGISSLSLAERTSRKPASESQPAQFPSRAAWHCSQWEPLAWQHGVENFATKPNSNRRLPVTTATRVLLIGWSG